MDTYTEFNGIKRKVSVIKKWDGSNWNDTVLPTYPSWTPHIEAINDVGNVAVGTIVLPFTTSETIVWTEKDNKWTETILSIDTPTKIAPNGAANLPSYANVRLINGEGDLIAGEIVGSEISELVVWKLSDGKWSLPRPLYATNLWEGIEARVINHKGDIIAGGVYIRDSDDNRDLYPAVWSGENYAIQYLKNTKDELNPGKVNALSKDGKIAAGFSERDNKKYATVWAGKNWEKVYELPDFTPDGLDHPHSAVLAMNDDGTLLGGAVTIKDDWETRAAIWYVQYNDKNEMVSNKLIKDKDDFLSVTITPINVDDTKKALAEMGRTTASLLALQHQGLKRLQKGCYTNEQGFCYRAYGDWSEADNSKDLNAGLTLGYQFGNGVLFGATLDHTLDRKLATEHNHTHRNVGLGTFARVDYANWYLSPSIAWNSYNTKLKRNLYAGTESEIQNANVKGLALSLTVGQDFNLANNTSLGWYSTLSHNKLSRQAFAEKNLVLPFSYGEMQLKETTLALGAKLELPITQKFSAVFNAEVEQQLSGNTPTFTASGKITQFSNEYAVNRTRGKVQLGGVYKLNPNFELFLTPYFESGIYGSKRYGAEIGISGRF
ncbi:autotransporter domain-containing protein [Ursidibacter arcticus]